MILLCLFLFQNVFGKDDVEEREIFKETREISNTLVPSNLFINLIYIVVFINHSNE